MKSHSSTHITLTAFFFFRGMYKLLIFSFFLGKKCNHMVQITADSQHIMTSPGVILLFVLFFPAGTYLHMMPTVCGQGVCRDLAYC